MTDVALSPRARADVDDIWSYTSARWDTRQAHTYVAQIGQACDALGQRPTLGRPCDHIRKGYRRHRVGSHVIFHRLRDNRVEVIRILHERMDFDAHL